MQRFKKNKQHTISLLYLDYFERKKVGGHGIGKGDKGWLSPLHPS